MAAAFTGDRSYHGKDIPGLDRIDRKILAALQDDGRITKLELGLVVFIEIKLDRMNPEVFTTFASAVKKAPEVLECHLIAGGFDYLVKARVRDMEAYREFLSEVLMTLPGVRETHTYPVMEEVKNTTVLPV